MNDQQKALAALDSIDPAALTYDEWLRVGMALHGAGATAADWDQWSRRDPARFVEGDCPKRWQSFRGNGRTVGIGTIVQYARAQGNEPDFREYDFGPGPADPGGAFDWDDPIYFGDAKPPPVAVDPNYLQAEELPPPAADWQSGDLVRYLAAMFDPNEMVGVVLEAWQHEENGRWLPKRGLCDLNAGELIEELRRTGDLGAVIGDPSPEAGAWIRINPLDGKGIRDENVTAFRHALLEADDGDLGKQLAAIRELQLPCTAVVHSGGKSIHALVRVDAPDMAEYRKRVDFLYQVARQNGIAPDVANRNPSRLSRLPGVSRAGKPQYLIATRIGKANWQEWRDWIEDLKDDLPNPEELPDRDKLPAKSPDLIAGILRQQHKMLLTGPSKAGKSFALIQLCGAIAAGKPWMGFPCQKGQVLYVNLELAADSCLRRFAEVLDAMGLDYDTTKRNIDVWNLRGYAVPLDRLANKLIRRAAGKKYVAVIIDPIYKVIIGDENSAADMARFCNVFDSIAKRLNCATIYAHHHSKGIQGQKRAIDRASGSGVFGRDPDACLDFIELQVDEKRRAVSEDQCQRAALAAYAAAEGLDDSALRESHGPHDNGLLAALAEANPGYGDRLRAVSEDAARRGRKRSAWRIEGTLREYETPDPVRVWFEYPVHAVDATGTLHDAKAEGEEPPWMEQHRAKEELRQSKAELMKAEIEEAIRDCGGPGEATVKDVAEAIGITDDAVRARIKKHTPYRYKGGVILPKKSPSTEDETE